VEFLEKPPDWLVEALPPALRELLEQGGWWVLLGVAGLLALGLVLLLAQPFWRRRPELAAEADDLRENLAAYPPLPPSTGDRRLTIEGVPVRLRLVVLAPAGTGSHVEAAQVVQLLDQVRPGLGAFVVSDHPQVRVWPRQWSTQGFARLFHSRTPLPEGEGQPSRWVLVAGRVKTAQQSFFLGLGLEALNPTPLGRRTLKAHEWPAALRIRVRE
jgi:hypothetical protein